MRNTSNIMKRCPTCDRSYEDDSITFCFDDGAVLLSAGADNRVRQTPVPTIKASDPTERTIVAQTSALTNDSRVPARDPDTVKEQGSHKLYLLPLAIIVFLLGGLVLALFLSTRKSERTEQAIATAPSPSPTTNPAELIFGRSSPSPSPTADTSGQLPIPKIYGQSYDAARRILIKAGWQPNKHESNYGTEADVQSGNGPLFWQRGYWELDACSGTGVAHCLFEFVDPAQRVLIVVTEGEEDESGAAHATVSRTYLKRQTK